jgi:adenylylsulfate kinase
MKDMLFEQAITDHHSPEKGKALWFTGLSGAGKTTLAKALYARLRICSKFCIILDGDDLRQGVNAGLGFSLSDRVENIRRIAEIAKLLINNGVICIVSTISPYPELRLNASQIIGKDHFFEVFINSPLEVCEERDVKGLYRKARQNKISAFTGIQDEYIPPTNPHLEIRTDIYSIEQSAEKLFTWFEQLVPVPVEA